MQNVTNRRWVALAFIAVAQLMIALDATIVSIALPSAQTALGVTDANRQWVVTAYTLSFGGLLLLGGRIADLAGRKRAFLIGLMGFATASIAGGAAPTFGVLIAARALQGGFAALLAPTALSLLAISFTEPRERANAFAVYGSIAGSGAAIGLLLGGVLTEYLSWRWCLYVNVPIAIIAAIGGAAVLPASSPAARSKFDVPGVVLATGGLVALVYASTAAVTNGWSSPAVEALFGAAIAAFALFVWRETRTPSPLLPLRIVADRNRGGAYLTVTLVIAGMFGAFLFLTYYFQVVLHYTPFQAGLAFLPLVVAQQAGSWLIASRLMPVVPPRALMAPGAIVAAAGMAFLTQVPLVAEVLLGVGVSCVMVPAFSTATQRVDRREAGVASATASAASQIGGSLGAALLNAIAVSSGGTVAHGFMVAAGWGAGILVLAAAVSGSLINAGRPGYRQAA